MLFFNPLRRAELTKYKDKTIEKTKKGVKKASGEAENIINTVSKFNLSRKTKKIVFIVLICITVFMLSIYIPSWFTRNEKEEYYSLAYDPSAVEFNKTLIEGKYGVMDFDEDGANNEDEDYYKTNIFDPDTDGDGYLDGYEIKHNMNPNKKNSIVSAVKKIVEENDSDLSTPYSDEGVILWPDSYDDRAYGYVIKDMNGYIIRNFNGWAQFPNSLNKKVYDYNDGKLRTMKYREREDAYYIDKDSFIIIIDDEPKFKYRFSAFGTTYVIKNKIIGNVLSFILPSKGTTYLKCQKVPLLGFNEKSTTTRINSLNFSNTFEDRLTANTNSLEDLSSVINIIKKGKCVYVSLYKDEYGESVGIIYGVDKNNNLLIADPETRKYSGKLHITLMGRNSIQDNKIVKMTWFDFEGLGFDSSNGDRINFFGTESDDEYVDYLL